MQRLIQVKMERFMNRMGLDTNKLMFNKLPGDFNKFYISNTYEFNGYIQGSEYKHFTKYGSHFNNTKKSGYVIVDNKKTLIDLNDSQDLGIIKKI